MQRRQSAVSPCRLIELVKHATMSTYSYSSYPSTSYSQYPSHPPSSSAPTSSYYGSAAYPPTTPSYPPPPTPAQQSQQDTQAFRAWCTQQLSALVENNRTVIHGLSYMAQQNAHRYAQVIAECIEQHIKRVSFVIIWTFGYR